MSALISGLAGAVITVVIAWLFEQTPRRAALTPDGWRMLRPSWFLNGVILLGALLTALILYILPSIVTTRPDTTVQERYAVAAGLIFGTMTVYLIWSAHGRRLRWRGDELQIRSVFGTEQIKALSDVRAVTKSDLWGEYRLSFQDGSTLWVSAYLHGIGDLIDPLRIDRNQP